MIFYLKAKIRGRLVKSFRDTWMITRLHKPSKLVKVVSSRWPVLSMKAIDLWRSCTDESSPAAGASPDAPAVGFFSGELLSGLAWVGLAFAFDPYSFVAWLLLPAAVFESIFLASYLTASSSSICTFL